jgi:hypothetical protein
MSRLSMVLGHSKCLRNIKFFTVIPCFEIQAHILPPFPKVFPWQKNINNGNKKNKTQPGVVIIPVVSTINSGG